jgi:hypothetical protein
MSNKDDHCPHGRADKCVQKAEEGTEVARVRHVEQLFICKQAVFVNIMATQRDLG